MKKASPAVLLAAALLIPSRAFPWGELGHFTVCEIAYRNLEPGVKTAVDQLLNGTEFIKECVWADKIRGGRRETGPWHYINFENGQSYPEIISRNGDAVQALIKSEDDLRDPKSGQAAKLEALKFLMHFAGDLHQPLHVGYDSDRGGNQVYVRWFNKTFHTYTFETMDDEVVTKRSKINLHSVWDTLILEKFAEKNLEYGENEKPSYKDYADAVQKASAKDIESWQKATYLDWMSESRAHLEKAYEIGEGRLGEIYYKKHIGFANQRLKMAGYRLAGLLNRIFKNVPLAKEEREMRERIKKALEGSLAVAP